MLFYHQYKLKDGLIETISESIMKILNVNLAQIRFVVVIRIKYFYSGLTRVLFKLTSF
jgi:hypothetical protein